LGLFGTGLDWKWSGGMWQMEVIGRGGSEKRRCDKDQKGSCGTWMYTRRDTGHDTYALLNRVFIKGLGWGGMLF
jgi:hypothetical protein